MGEEPSRDQHLLLIAAGQIVDRLVHVGRLDPELALHTIAFASDRALSDETGGDKILIENRHLHIGEDVEKEETAGLLAVLGDEGHPVPSRLIRIGDRAYAAV